MYKLDLPLDTHESFAIERRKNMEKNRQARIFNAKERTIGVRHNEKCSCFSVSLNVCTHRLISKSWTNR